MKQAVIRISVRNLVEFLLRSGDLDNRFSGRRETDAMQAGSRLHRKIQGRMGSGYHAEVSLKHQVELKELCVSLEGRADGIWEEDGMVMVDEIKGTWRDISLMTEAAPVHLAQAMCYAWIYAKQNDRKAIRTRMIYADLDTEELRYFTRDHTWEELSEWFDGLMAEYEKDRKSVV